MAAPAHINLLPLKIFGRKNMTMLTMDARSASSFNYRKPGSDRSGLHRLFTAAIVNSQFREKLLREPENALACGYLGQAFTLTDQEKTIISNVRARDLTDFAQKVNQALKAI
jgi:hypothetical protein